ncbi:MAG TPA: adenosylhomocysteinase [Bacillota bacterium]|jgi:adenosylhomocysteinase
MFADTVKLTDKGKDRIDWAKASMPVLTSIAERWTREKPLAGRRIGACLHVTTETANLAIALKAGGAGVALCASNPLSTQDDVVVALNEIHGIPTYAKRGEGSESYYKNIETVLWTKPEITMDDGADLVATLHTKHTELIPGIIAGTEETTTGVIRLRAMARDGALGYPIVAVNEAMTKHMFDNRYGTGQSTFDGIMRSTNRLIAGSAVVVAGYGWCGKGVAARAKGLGARVYVVEIDPIRALEAAMDGFTVVDMEQAAPLGDLFITVTGDIKVIDRRHIEKMKDGAILCNAGHFNVELDLPGLEAMTVERRTARENVEEFIIRAPGERKRIYVIAEGRLVNLAAAEGHPASVMDMSFANQALVCEWLCREKPALEKRVYSVPEDIDRLVAKLKLESMGMAIEKLTPEQEHYLTSWEVGTR